MSELKRRLQVRVKRRLRRDAGLAKAKRLVRLAVAVWASGAFGVWLGDRLRESRKNLTPVMAGG